MHKYLKTSYVFLVSCVQRIACLFHDLLKAREMVKSLGIDGKNFKVVNSLTDSSVAKDYC